VSRTSLATEQILTILAATPSRIAEFTVDLTEAQLHAAPSPGEWSLNEVLAHLRSCADVWGNCIVTIIQQDTPTIRAVNPRTWIKSTNYLEQKFRPSLQACTEQRAELLAILEALKPKAWSRSAIVTGAGSILQSTVQSYAERMAIHERPHVKQIKRVASLLQK
jgi:DinB family protein